MKTFTCKKTAVFCTILLTGILSIGCSSSNTMNQIELNSGNILYNGKAISTETSSAVFSSTFIEFHEDVAEQYKDVTNTIVNITKGGTYEISGEASDTQIRINTPNEEVTLVLNGVTLSCNTAPAILIEEAADPQKAGEAGVTISLAQNSINLINASHIAEYVDENGVEIDYDGAISSKVSLILEGDGTLQVTGDKEGIETQLHLTINGGNIEVVSADDPINASEDGISTITINDGIINCSVQNGEEGDGIDSNGYIYINGGSVLAQSHSNSADSGLDADLGIVINGGIVCATGNMYEEISEESAQQHVQFYFAEKQNGGIPLVVTDTEGNYILAYTPVNDYTILEFSLPDIIDGAIYHLYRGGTITGTITNGIYTDVTAYEDGTQMGHRGIMQDNGRPNFGGQIPEYGSTNMEPPKNMERPTDVPQSQQSEREKGQRPEHPEDMQMQRPEGERAEGFIPENFDPNNLPEGFEPPAMPQGNFGNMGGRFDSSIPLTADFVIDSENRVYTGIAPLE